MSKNVGLLGSGGQADEIESYLSENQKVIFKAVSKDYLVSGMDNLIDIESTEHIEKEVIAAVGAPALRKEMVEKWKGKNYISLIAKDAVVNEHANLGKGSIIAPGAVITTNVIIGEHAIVNINSSINHDCKIGDFVTIGPGVCIAGRVTIGDGVFIGIGASISNNIKIADGSVIGAGAVVIEDVTDDNSVVVGVPGKVIRNNKTWLREI